MKTLLWALTACVGLGAMPADAVAWTLSGDVSLHPHGNWAKCVGFGDSPASEYSTVSKLKLKCDLNEESSIVDSPELVCDRYGTNAIHCLVTGVDTTITENCQYCAKGDGWKNAGMLPLWNDHRQWPLFGEWCCKTEGSGLGPSSCNDEE